MRGREKEELIERTLTEQYEKYYRLAYSYVKNETVALQIVGEAAYKAIYLSDKLKHPEQADSWIQGILQKEAKVIKFPKKVSNSSARFRLSQLIR